MIREDDVREAIAEMQGQKNPNANTCIKLAAYYIIQDHLSGEPELPKDYKPDLSSGADPEVINYDGDSEFAKAIRGKSQKSVIGVFDELMSTLHVMHPRLYDGVMNKIYE